MKTLLAIFFVAALLGFFAVRALEQNLSGMVILAPTPTTTPAQTGGGEPRKIPIATTTNSNPSGFQGPTSAPHIQGPPGPPPGS